MKQTPLTRALAFYYRYPEYFREGFDDWLIDNFALQLLFNAEAKKVGDRGRTHYSAYTIIEYMRHDMAVREVDSAFKINNNWASSMSRLFCFMHPTYAHLFEMREMLSTAA